jgi:anti-anti-sigma regulatory factor
VIVVTVDRADLALVDLLARLQLEARRLGGSVVLRDPCEVLRELLDLVGLAELLPLETGREAEGGIELGIEEVVQPGDPTA